MAVRLDVRIDGLANARSSIRPRRKGRLLTCSLVIVKSGSIQDATCDRANLDRITRIVSIKGRRSYLDAWRSAAGGVDGMAGNWPRLSDHPSFDG